MSVRLHNERSARHWRREGKFGPRGVIRTRSELVTSPDWRRKMAELKEARDLYLDVLRGLDR